MDGWMVRAVEAIRLGMREPAVELHAALLAARRRQAESD
jgi:hypothetical protein